MARCSVCGGLMLSERPHVHGRVLVVAGRFKSKPIDARDLGSYGVDLVRAQAEKLVAENVALRALVADLVEALECELACVGPFHHAKPPGPLDEGYSGRDPDDVAARSGLIDRARKALGEPKP
jgi:hypothetical protein